ncbi:MAG: hypothetical protein K0Q59_1630, partial [Paenibacillus sp.]|nr:hypothetical protein [Paenibacillus sp.]
FYREVKGIVLELTERCMATLEPGCVKLGVGRSRVAISRRKKSGTEVIMAPEPDAEIDDQLSVLALHDGQDRLKAILFSAGCHPTSMGAIYKISSEFCGNACMRLEQEFPEAIAVFMQGCAGDLRPRRSAADGRFHLCSPETMQAIGDDLAGEVMAVLRDGEFTAIEGPFRSTIGSLDLLTAEPDEDYLASLLAGEKGDYYRKAAERTVQAERNGIVKTKLPLYVQTWLLSDRAVLVALESEIPTGYSLRLKTEHADKTLIVLGYANGVYSYIPTRRILEEGGYEAEHPFTIGFKSRFALETEDRIVGEVLRQMTVLTE